MSARGLEIVVGVDFGTTYSGVSWAINGGSKNIRLITNWRDPEALNANKDKVPSLITYVNGRPDKWGYDVTPNEQSFRWIKILLEENHKYTSTVEPAQKSYALLREVQKTAEEVVSDYLRLLWNYTIEDIRKFHPNYDELFDVRVVLTVPAIWSPAAKFRTITAAKLAHMPEPTLVTEPEAAALATLRDKSEENELQVGDAFVVCDAGGGTVDLISYKVLNLKPLKIEECAIGSGGLCGSAFLDVAFTKCIETQVGPTQYERIRERYRNEMMRKFEYGIKRSFTGEDDPDFSVVLIGVEDDPRNGIIDETIKIKPATLEVCFDHVAQQIQTLVASQVAEVQNRALNVKAILLVGGFGESKFLHNRLKALHVRNGIQVLQVNGAWSSICRGATLWGLEHPNKDSSKSSSLNPNGLSANASTVTSRLSRYSYGISISEPFDLNRHLIQDYYKDPQLGTAHAIRQMRWLLRRGDKIEDGKKLSMDTHGIVEVGYFNIGVMKFSINLWYNEDPSPPSRQTDAVKYMWTVKCQFKRSKLRMGKAFTGADNKKYRQVDYTLTIELGNASLGFLVAHGGEQVGRVEVEYEPSLMTLSRQHL